MGRAYISAAAKHLPQAKIVFDRFHLIKIVNDTLNAVRRQVFAEATENDQRVLAGTKYLLLRNEEDLDDDNKKRLSELLALNTPLSIACILKEDLRQIWEQDSKKRQELPS
jgi:transposase